MRARHRRRALRARGRARRDARDRRVGRARESASPSPTRSCACSSSSTSPRPDTIALRHRRARGAPTHGRGARASGAGRRRHGDAGARVGHPRRAGLRARVGHPVRRRPGEEPLRRAHVHPAQPEAARPGCAAQAQPARREHPRQAARGRRGLDRPRHHAAPAGVDAARGGRGRGALPRVVAALQVALLLRPRHRPPLGAARRRPRRSARSATSSASTRSPTSSSTASPPPPARRPTAFCTACLSGEYPVPVPTSADSKLVLELDADGQTSRPARGPPRGDARVQRR